MLLVDHQTFYWLAGSLGDEVEVLVEMQDDQVRDGWGAVMALVDEQVRDGWAG